MNQPKTPITHTLDINHKEFLTVEELAAYVGLATATIQKMKNKGELPHYRFAGQVLFKREEVFKLIANSRCRSVEDVL